MCDKRPFHFLTHPLVLFETAHMPGACIEGKLRTTQHGKRCRQIPHKSGSLRASSEHLKSALKRKTKQDWSQMSPCRHFPAILFVHLHTQHTAKHKNTETTSLITITQCNQMISGYLSLSLPNKAQSIIQFIRNNSSSIEWNDITFDLYSAMHLQFVELYHCQANMELRTKHLGVLMDDIPSELGVYMTRKFRITQLRAILCCFKDSDYRKCIDFADLSVDFFSFLEHGSHKNTPRPSSTLISARLTCLISLVSSVTGC